MAPKINLILALALGQHFRPVKKSKAKAKDFLTGLKALALALALDSAGQN
jgi:hypothetical protein